MRTGYALMLDIISYFFLALSHWHDGCACHDDDPLEGSAMRPEQRQYYRSRRSQRKCAMNGRRAPDMASGAMVMLVQRWLTAMQNALLIELAAFGVGPVDRGEIMSDFTIARRHIWTYFELKFSFWLQPPWSLMGMAHHSLDVARRCARRNLQLPPGNHFWSMLLLSNPVGRAEVTAFAFDYRVNLDDLPLLRLCVGIFMMAYTTERWVEALHALSKRVIQSAHHVGPVHIAFFAIQTPLRDALSQEARLIEELARYAAATRNPYMCGKAMRLSGHRTVQRLLNEGVLGRFGHLNRFHTRELTQLLYHVDAVTLHQDLPDTD